MLRFKSFTHSPQAVLFPALFLIATFGAACGGGKPNSTSDSAPASSSSSAIGGPAFEGEITAKMFAGAQPMDIRYATKGSRMRAEMRLSPGSPQMDAVLMDFSAGTQTMLFAQNKSYMTIDLGKMAGEMAGKDTSGEFPKVTPTDKTETIAGFTCQHWLIGDKQDTDVCMAKGLGYFAGGGGGGILDQLKNLASREKIKAQLDANPEFAKFVEGGAFPLKVSHIENGQSKTILEVTSVERKSLDDSLFTVPADYKKMEIPGMPGAKQ